MHTAGLASIYLVELLHATGSWRTLLFTQIWMLLTWEYLGGINLVLPLPMCREKEGKGIDEQGAEGPEEEGQARWGDMHVHGGDGAAANLGLLKNGGAVQSATPTRFLAGWTAFRRNPGAH